MPMKSVVAVLLSSSLLAAAVAAAAHATDYVSVNAGYYNAFQSEDTAAQFGAEYRAEEWMYGIRPVAGAFGTTDGSAYGYAGFNWDVALVDNQLYLIPNFAAGLYREGGGKDLGGAIEFRSGIELAYQFPNAHRLGMALNHLSNASIYDKNPGEESVIVTYSVPTGALLGR